jgi:pSer/pThr/pTyr-binding forkhead associated (FHA) protein
LIVTGLADAAMGAAGGSIDVWQTTTLAAVAVLGGLVVAMHVKGKRPPYGYLYRRRGRKVRRFRIETGVCRIGRHPDNELRLNDRSISRFHAELVRNHNGTFSIYDAGSKNGIRVGSRPVHSSVLREGDLIDLGEIHLKFSRRPRDYNIHRSTVVLESNSTRFDTKRRREHRHDLATQVRLYNDQSGWISGSMRNVGRDGAFIETNTKLPARLPVDIVVAVAESGKRKWLHLTGEIVWSDAKGAGVSFTDRDPAVLDQLLNNAA